MLAVASYESTTSGPEWLSGHEISEPRFRKRREKKSHPQAPNIITGCPAPRPGARHETRLLIWGHDWDGLCDAAAGFRLPCTKYRTRELRALARQLGSWPAGTYERSIRAEPHHHDQASLAAWCCQGAAHFRSELCAAHLSVRETPVDALGSCRMDTQLLDNPRPSNSIAVNASRGHMASHRCDHMSWILFRTVGWNQRSKHQLLQNAWLAFS